jgi:hypothetical protein
MKEMKAKIMAIMKLGEKRRCGENGVVMKWRIEI